MVWGDGMESFFVTMLQCFFFSFFFAVGGGGGGERERGRARVSDVFLRRIQI